MNVWVKHNRSRAGHGRVFPVNSNEVCPPLVRLSNLVPGKMCLFPLSLPVNGYGGATRIRNVDARGWHRAGEAARPPIECDTRDGPWEDRGIRPPAADRTWRTACGPNRNQRGMPARHARPADTTLNLQSSVPVRRNTIAGGGGRLGPRARVAALMKVGSSWKPYSWQPARSRKWLLSTLRICVVS